MYILSFHSVVTLGFDRADYQFTEGEAIELVVQKSAPLGTELPVLVVYDEMTVEGTFEAGVNATNNITISVTSRDDVIALEPDEVFIVTLTLVQTNPQILIPNPLANVTITDDDGECKVIRSRVAGASQLFSYMYHNSLYAFTM